MIIGIIASVLIWGSAAVLLMRMINNSGIGINNYFTQDKALCGSFEPGLKDTAAVFGLALLFRVLVLLLSVSAIYIFTGDKGFNLQEFINRYCLWDAKHYQNIAIGGYAHYVEKGEYPTLVFLPLYPWAIKAFSIILRDQIISGLTVSFLAYAGGCAFIYRLMASDYNKATAVRAIVFISVFPHALFFGTMMNESMTLLTVTATLYFIRQHKWPLVGVFGALAAMTRLSGLVVAIPAAVEWFEEYRILEKLKEKKIGEAVSLFITKGLWIFLILAGLAIYLFCNWKVTGNPFKFLEYEKSFWHQQSVYFGKGIAVPFEQFASSDKFTRFAIWLPEIMAIIFVVTMLVAGLRRHRTMYTAYLCAMIVMNTGISWPLSLGRYFSCAVPAFMILSDISERHKWTEPMITAVMAIGFGILLVAYFQQLQIL